MSHGSSIPSIERQNCSTINCTQLLFLNRIPDLLWNILAEINPNVSAVTCQKGDDHKHLKTSNQNRDTFDKINLKTFVI